MRAGAVIMLLVALPGWWGTPQNARAQSTLERLERQIRQRVGTPENEDAGALHPLSTPPTTSPSPTPPPESRRTGKNVKAAYLGVLIDDRADRGRGVRIVNVQRGSPAEKAGLRRQDLIVRLQGIRVRQVSELSEVLDIFAPGQAIDFDIVREGKQQVVRVVLGPRPTIDLRPTLPETVPLPPGEAIPKPPQPQPPDSQSPKPEASRIEQLERRVDELEHRVAEMDRALKALKDKKP